MYLLLKDMVLKQTWKGNCVFYSKQLVAAWSGGLKEILVLRRNNHIDYNICHRLRIYIGYYIGILYRHSGFNAIYLPSIPYFLSQNIKNDFAVNKMKHNIEMTCYLINFHCHKYSVSFSLKKALSSNIRKAALSGLFQNRLF